MRINSNTVLQKNPVKFQFGKYRNTPIENCEDTRYICWYISTLTVKDDINQVAIELNRRGCYVAVNQNPDGTWFAIAMTREAMEWENAKNKERDDLMKNVFNGNSFKWTFTRNCDGCGYYEDKGYHYYKFFFPNTHYVNGRYPYTMVVINDKAKKIKNTEFTITKYKTRMDGKYLIVEVEEMMDQKDIDKMNKKKAREAAKLVKSIERDRKNTERMMKKAEREAKKALKAVK